MYLLITSWEPCLSNNGSITGLLGVHHCLSRPITVCCGLSLLYYGSLHHVMELLRSANVSADLSAHIHIYADVSADIFADISVDSSADMSADTSPDISACKSCNMEK